MRTFAWFVTLLGAFAIGVCAAQAPSSAPQVLIGRPQIGFAAPRPTFKAPPRTAAAPSSAPSLGPAPVASDSQVQEVTVTAHRSISVAEGRRFYIESTPGDSTESAMLYQNSRVCADQSLPAPKRLVSCNMSIWMVMHGASMENADRAKAYVARGDAFQRNGEDQPAIRDFKSAIKFDPGSARPWIGMGNLYAARSDYLHAFENYDRAMSIAPDDPVVNDNRGTALEALGRHDEAIIDFTRAIDIDPRDTSAYANRATAYLAIKRPDLAIADLTQVVHAAPGNALAYYDLGTAYELSGDVDKAEASYREVASRLPSYAPAAAALGRLDAKHNPDLALAELGAAIRLDPKSPALRTRALLYLRLQQPGPAVSDLDRAIANDGSDDIAWANRGVAKSMLGDLAGAIADCTRAIDLAPTAANRVNRGNAYATLHRDDAALADFDIVLGADPHNLPALTGRANANYAGRRFTASLEDYTRLIEADPSNAMAYFRRGNIRLDRQEFGLAFNDYSASLRLDSNQPAVLVNRSIAAARLGRRSDAANDQRRALALDPAIFDGKH